MPLGKRHCGAFGVSGCEPQRGVQCEPQNEVQCEAFKTALERRLSLLTFCPTMQMGRHRVNGPPPAHEVEAHERFPGYVGPCGRSRLWR